MPQRLRYPEVAPEGFAALSGFGHYINTQTSLEPVLKGFVDLHVSQLNGCHFCQKMHTAELHKHHEPLSRINAVMDWRASDAFTPRERAALAWAETLTLLVTGTRASDEEYAAVSGFFHGKDLVDLTYAIANINAWNRLGLAFMPEWNPKAHAANHPEATPVQDAVGDDGGKVAED
jgi:AhpD family alkylhydroperoxidase